MPIKYKELMLGCMADIQNTLSGLSGASRYEYLQKLRPNFELWRLTKSMRSFCGLDEFQEFAKAVDDEISTLVLS